jgi:hypothetical protein
LENSACTNNVLEVTSLYVKELSVPKYPNTKEGDPIRYTILEKTGKKL